MCTELNEIKPAFTKMSGLETAYFNAYTLEFFCIGTQPQNRIESCMIYIKAAYKPSQLIVAQITSSSTVRAEQQ